jgi:hypothetical protein
MPSARTVYRHARLDPVFARDLELAREMRANWLAHMSLTRV